MDLVIRGKRVLLPTGIEPAALHIREGRIGDVTAYEVVGHASFMKPRRTWRSCALHPAARAS